MRKKCMCVCACTQSMYPSHNSIKSISPPTLLPSVLFTHSTAWLIMIKERLKDGSLQSYIKKKLLYADDVL